VPAIFFLSDYGTADEFVGVVHAVLHHLAPLVPVIDLSHQIPPFDVAAGAAMLERCAPYLGAGVVLAVVDPGVGTARRALAVRTAVGGEGWSRTPLPSSGAPSDSAPRRGPAWLVGPDNGLLVPAAGLLGGAEEAVELRSDDRREAGEAAGGPGPTFDGRDVFAPAAAHLALGGAPATLGAAVDPATLVSDLPGRQIVPHRVDPALSAVESAVVSIDRFGNVQLALRPPVLEEIGLMLGGVAEVTVRPVAGPAPVSSRWGRSPPAQPLFARRVVAFGELAAGELGLLSDSSGRVALVLDRASAAQRLHLSGPGAEVTIVPADRGVG
jgi:hypothetical protein